MVLINKRNRCGKLYKYYLIAGQPEEYNAIRLAKMSRSGDLFTQKDINDLCPECMAELKKFIKGDNNG